MKNWVFWEDEKLASLVDFLATPIFFKVEWEKLKMLLSMRELIQYKKLCLSKAIKCGLMN
jgi:hypothetical protein